MVNNNKITVIIQTFLFLGMCSKVYFISCVHVDRLYYCRRTQENGAFYSTRRSLSNFQRCFVSGPPSSAAAEPRCHDETSLFRLFSLFVSLTVFGLRKKSTLHLKTA